jgi:hypothetical protein
LRAKQDKLPLPTAMASDDVLAFLNGQALKVELQREGLTGERRDPGCLIAVLDAFQQDTGGVSELLSRCEHRLRIWFFSRFSGCHQRPPPGSRVVPFRSSVQRLLL